MPTPAAPPRSGDREVQLHAVGELMPRLVRLAHAYKAVSAGQGRDRAAHLLLFPLERLGPLRQGALAGLVHADPSTVSRHVATLVDQGLVRRVADATGGRASRLRVTDAGHAVLGRLRAEREAHLAQLTAAWSDAEVATFAVLLGRLVDGMAAALPDDTDAPAPTSPEETR